MDFSTNQAIYLQIADYICEQILLNQWPPGGRIPSVRELGGQLEVNPNTAMRTFDFLQQKGIIYNKRGIGYFVADDAPARIRSYRREQFLDNELPRIFRTMYLLDITLPDLEQRYDTFKQAEFGINANT